MKILVNISRILVGLLFIFSGLIKANDPLGFSYKLVDYFVVFEMEFLNPMALGLSMFICVIEIVLGFAVLLGTFMNITAWLLLLMIIFFTWLTGYSAITGEVTDCGCFGDAIKLTPTESFMKDVILLIFIGIIFIKRNSIELLLKEKIARTLLALSIILPTGFTFACYTHLPKIDFRPYKVGNNIYDLMQIPDGAPLDIFESTFYYKNKTTGEIKEFPLANLPSGDDWDFHDRTDKLIQEGYQPPIHDFSIINADGDDYTEDFLLDEGFVFILFGYDLENADHVNADKVNAIADKSSDDNYIFIAMTASPEAEINNFREATGAKYNFYFADATALKTVVRSNPGLVLLKGGVVQAKWHINDIPELTDLESNHLK